jgi:hypothetical protein
MKHFLTTVLALLCCLQPALAQERIFRCGNNEYINNAQEAQARGCKPIDGGNITIISAPKASASAAQAGRGNGNGQANQRVVSNEQRARDSDARAILEGELKKLEARQGELLKEYNNGEPEKQGTEARNYQKYLDRVAELKANIARNDSDIAGIRRELARLPASK